MSRIDPSTCDKNTHTLIMPLDPKIVARLPKCSDCGRPLTAHYYSDKGVLYCPHCYRCLPKNHDVPKWRLP